MKTLIFTADIHTFQVHKKLLKNYEQFSNTKKINEKGGATKFYWINHKHFKINEIEALYLFIYLSLYFDFVGGIIICLIKIKFLSYSSLNAQQKDPHE